MTKPQVVSDQNFETEVIKSDTPVLVDFWAVWCGPCRMVAPVLEEIATEQGDKVKIAKLDVDANPITAGRFGVRAIPTMILFKNGREAQRVVGYVPKEKLLQQIQPHFVAAAAESTTSTTRASQKPTTPTPSTPTDTTTTRPTPPTPTTPTRTN
ncbi:MAG TPA: thioredoxin [Candidatus Limnocylindria bacterium]|jgi:thioredoxin 1|nr:thioredoxin [Candidatus Limnocylindria bacterium]